MTSYGYTTQTKRKPTTKPAISKSNQAYVLAAIRANLLKCFRKVADFHRNHGHKHDESMPTYVTVWQEAFVLLKWTHNKGETAIYTDYV